MAIVQSIQFQNFKRFDRFSISCRAVNILVGPNNAGKSTALEALRVLRDVHCHATRFRGAFADQGTFGVCRPMTCL